jgi:hypothetical protein
LKIISFFQRWKFGVKRFSRLLVWDLSIWIF